MMLSLLKALLALLLLQIKVGSLLAKPPTPQYSNATLQLSRGVQMAAYMNAEADPCDDFYSWACGRWALNHPTTLSKRKTSFTGLLEDLYVSKCAEALQQPSSSNDTSAADAYLENLLKTLFDSCRGIKSINIVGYAPIWDALELHGGWPLITDNEWFETEYDWLRSVVLAKRKFNADVFIGFKVVKDLRNPEANRIQLSAPQLALEKPDEQRRYIVSKLQHLFPEMPNSWSQEIAAQVIQVEEQLARAVSNAGSEDTPLERYVAELKVSYGKFVDLNRYLQLMFDHSINEKVYETPKGYFKNLVDIIRLTPKLTLANYTIWKVLDQFDLGGNKVFCVRKLMKLLPQELEYFFFSNYEDSKLFMEIQTLFHNIKYNLYDEMQTSPSFNWISPQTLQNLREKLRSMRVEILQPHRKVSIFQGGIKPADIQVDQYYSNIINLLEWQNEQQLLKLHQAAALLSTSQSSEHYEQKLLPAYNARTNTIQFPVVFLQPRFLWDPTYPVAIKHATFGFILAQQIVRALSEDNSEADDHKVWDVASELALAKRTSCYALQASYAVKEYHGRNVTDRERLKKALMDNGGLSIAYRLYDKWTRGRHQRQLDVLPRLSLTHKQQFFLAYAQLFCAEDFEGMTQYEDLPEALRVNGAAANSIEFSKEFQCSSESKLKPEEKCVIF